MRETSGRLLRLLGVLQAHPGRSGTDLAGLLGVTTRTVRRDIDRLRELGYPVETDPGRPGYRLGSGGSLPPLLLDNDEALAVTMGLQSVASGSTVEGMAEPAGQALAKLEQVLPSPVRHRVRALTSSTARVETPRETISLDQLTRITDVCVRRERLRFEYTKGDGARDHREVEPLSLIHFKRRWYLVAWDPARSDWRSFRADRMRVKTPNGARFPPREPPPGGAVAYLDRQLSASVWPVQAAVTMHAPAEAVSAGMWPGMGAVEAIDASRSLLHIGSSDVADLAWMITALGIDFTVTDPPELVAAIAAIGRRCASAVAAQGPGSALDPPR